MTTLQRRSDTQHETSPWIPRAMHRNASASVLAIVMASAAVSAEATIPWSSLSSGAASLSGANSTLRGSFGPLNTAVSNGNGDTLTPGFWTGVSTGVSGCNPADVTGDGLLDLSDVSLFISAFLTGGSEADLNGDGLLDLFDVNQFVTAFAMGCP